MENVLNEIEYYYDRLLSCCSSSGKSNNGAKIIALMKKYPKTKHYWIYYPNRRAWDNRFCKIRNYDKQTEIHIETSSFRIENGIVIDEITDLKNAPAVSGVYLLGQCSFNPYTNAKQFWVKVGKAKDIYKRMKSGYTTACPCTALLDTFETKRESDVESLCQILLKLNSLGKCQNNSEWWLVSEEVYKKISQEKFEYFHEALVRCG